MMCIATILATDLLEALAASPEIIALALLVVGVIIWLFRWLFLSPRVDETVDASLMELTGMTPQLAGQLRRFGVDSDRMLVRLSPRGQQELQSELNLHSGEYDRWRAEILRRWRGAYLPSEFRDDPLVHPDPELGALYAKRPPNADDLTQLRGISPVAARRLNTAGIYRFAQLRTLTSDQQQTLWRRFGLTEFEFASVPQPTPEETAEETVTPAPDKNGAVRDKSPAKEATNDETSGNTDRGGAQTTSAAAATPLPQGEIPRTAFHPQLGRVYTTRPPHHDDLAQLPAIDSAAAERMHSQGVYTFDQIRSMSRRQKMSLVDTCQLSAEVFCESSPFGERETGSVEKGARSRRDARRQRRASAGAADASINTPAPEIKLSASSAFRRALGLGGPSLAGLWMSAAAGQDSAETKPAESKPPESHSAASAAAEPDSEPAPAEPTNPTQAAVATADSLNDSAPRPHAVAPTVRPEAKLFHDLALVPLVPGVFSGHSVVDHGEQVIFSGNQPEFWGQDIRHPQPGVTLALSADAIRHDLNYVRIRRLDTDQSVVTAVTKGQLFRENGSNSSWNGACEEYSGGRHLGICSDQVPGTAEVRWGQGGWGFGHVRHQNDQQVVVWAGQPVEWANLEISVGCRGQLPGTVIFRSSDPGIWDQAVRSDFDHFAVPLQQLDHPARYVRLMRVDTGEAVILPITLEQLDQCSEFGPIGWNGAHEHFSGGYHLGIFHRHLSQAVEVRFGDGGWGFGHPYGTNDRQAYVWAGQEIGETVFEITVLYELPSYLRHELLG